MRGLLRWLRILHRQTHWLGPKLMGHVYAISMLKNADFGLKRDMLLQVSC